MEDIEYPKQLIIDCNLSLKTAGRIQSWCWNRSFIGLSWP